MELIEFKGEFYPALQAEGHASQYAIPFAKKVLKYCQTIYDIGCNREEWKYPGAIAIDPNLNRYDAMNFPESNNKPDGIFSSHMLEHFPGSWVNVLDYWHSKLCYKGIVFLYLPDHSQKYWRPHFNRKHIHAFTPEIVKQYFIDQPEMWENIFCSGVDLNNSFICIAQKK